MLHSDSRPTNCRTRPARYSLYIAHALIVIGVVFAIALMLTNRSEAQVTGTKHVVVLRVRFNDKPDASRYTQANVQSFFANLNTLWGTNSSYGNISLDSQVSTLFRLPGNRSEYIDDFPDGDLSNGAKYMKVLNDSVANSPAGITWTNIDAVVVVMAETSTSEFHRGQGNKCNLPMGPGSTNTPLVGCAIFSENPGSTDVEVWGRWAHEIGHAFQVAGPAHPSNYNSNFEQMDRNYPGQTGVFEKQRTMAFGWMPDAKYFIITPATGGATAGVFAEEFNPASRPNAQAIKAYITGVGSAYYLISVRRRVLGDDLNDTFTPNGIPDEGVLIERVTENTDPWVTVQGKGGNRDRLWKQGDTFTNAADGIFINISKKFDDDNYQITVRYSDNAGKPDVGMTSWLQPPGNTYETTDIWVDSPVNGFGTFRYGNWSDLMGGTVPTGNGDDPAIGQVNRLFARVRNYGTVTATNVTVHFDVTDPLGLGINGSNGFVEIGAVTSAQFPGLASIAPGGSTDVFIEWTPNATLTPEQIAAGTFAFHSCVRVRMNHLPGETVFGNQDGNGQQENIGYFQAPAAGGGAPSGAPFKTIINLRNDDPLNKKFFTLAYDQSKVPPGWKVVINGSHFDVPLGPGEVKAIPVEIVPSVPMPLGRSAGVVVFASSQRLLVNDKDPKDKHPDFQTLGGVLVEGHAVARTKLQCSARATGDGVVFTGKLEVGPPGTMNQKIPIFLEGVDNYNHFLTRFTALATMNYDGSFTGIVRRGKFPKGICLFAGTNTLASATSGFVKVK